MKGAERRVTLKSRAQIERMAIAGEVVHGVPSARRVVREGSLVSVDVGAIIEGWHGDAARTYIVGEVPDAARRLVDATREAMYAGIPAATPSATSPPPSRTWPSRTA